MLATSIHCSESSTMLIVITLFLALLLRAGAATPSPQYAPTTFDRSVPKSLFFSLEELSRLVAISYCVGNTGIQEPFECLNHCSDFKGFALVTVLYNLLRLLQNPNTPANPDLCRHGTQASSTRAQVATSSSRTRPGRSASSSSSAVRTPFPTPSRTS